MPPGSESVHDSTMSQCEYSAPRLARLSYLALVSERPSYCLLIAPRLQRVLATLLWRPLQGRIRQELRGCKGLALSQERDRRPSAHRRDLFRSKPFHASEEQGIHKVFAGVETHCLVVQRQRVSVSLLSRNYASSGARKRQPHASRSATRHAGLAAQSIQLLSYSSVYLLPNPPAISSATLITECVTKRDQRSMTVKLSQVDNRLELMVSLQ